MINYDDISFSDVKDYQIDLNRIVNIYNRDFQTSSGTFDQIDVIQSGYTYFRSHKTGNPKPVLVFLKNDVNQDNPTPVPVTQLRIEAGKYNVQLTLQAEVASANLIGDVLDYDYIVAVCYYPFDDNGKIELYDEYDVEGNFVDLPFIMPDSVNANQILTQMTQIAVNKRIGVPSKVAFIDNVANAGNLDAFNKVYDGNFSFTKLNLPPQNNIIVGGIKYGFAQDQIRNLDTQITKTLGYRVEVNKEGRAPDLLEDKLAIKQFTVIDEEYINVFANTFPRNYLLVTTINSLPNPSVKKYLYIKIPGCGALRNRTLMLSFDAKNEDVTIAEEIAFQVEFTEYYGGSAGSYSGIFERSTVKLLGAYKHFDILLKQSAGINPIPSNITSDFNNYVEVKIALPTFNAQFSITNLYLDYGNTPVTYPREPNAPDIANYGVNNYTDVISSNYGFRARDENPGKILDMINPSDTETTMVADGRTIFPDDVYTYNYFDNNGYVVDQEIAIPVSKPNKTGLYDLIVKNGIPDNTPDTHVAYDDLSHSSNPLWNGVANKLNISGVFYWRYQTFKPVCNFTDGAKNKAGDLVLQVKELHRGQNIPPEFTFKGYFQKDDIQKIWFGCSPNNFLAEFEKQGGDMKYFKPLNSPLNPDFGSVAYSSSLLKLGYFTGAGGVQVPIFSNVVKNNDFVFVNSVLSSWENKIYDTKFLFANKKFGCLDVNLLDINEQNTAFALSNNSTSDKNVNSISIVHFYFDDRDSTDGTEDLFAKPSIQSIKCQKGDFPATNPDFKISLNTDKTLPSNQNFINMYYQGDTNIDYCNLTSPVGTNLEGKSLMSFIGINNYPAYAISLLRDNSVDYAGVWFYFESSLQRSIKVKQYSGGNVATIKTETMPYNKICLWFQTGADSKPINSAIPPDSIYLECDISGLKLRTDISKKLQDVINGFAVKIPDFQGCITKAIGLSEFENKIQNQVTSYSTFDNKKTIYCNNYRNSGYKISENIANCENHKYNAGNNTNLNRINIIRYKEYDINSNPYNIALVYKHITLC